LTIDDEGYKKKIIKFQKRRALRIGKKGGDWSDTESAAEWDGVGHNFERMEELQGLAIGRIVHYSEKAINSDRRKT